MTTQKMNDVETPRVVFVVICKDTFFMVCYICPFCGWVGPSPLGLKNEDFIHLFFFGVV